jgi:hypothetical protein
MKLSKNLKASTLFEVLVALSLVAIAFSLGSRVFINIQSRNPQSKIIRASDQAFRTTDELYDKVSEIENNNGKLNISEEVLTRSDFPDLTEVHAIVKDSLSGRKLAIIKYLRK